MNVLIVPDKFKGTLTAQEAAKLIAQGWRQERPKDHLELLPMSDGGDGFGEVMASLLGAKVQSTPAVDAAHRPHPAKWWWDKNAHCAIIESAQVIGLASLPSKHFHPFELDTFGLGAVLQAARQRGAEQMLIGIGGSATNDGGFGLARALGWEFHDETGRRIEQWTHLARLARISRPLRDYFPVRSSRGNEALTYGYSKEEPPHVGCYSGEIIVAVDVQNPLLGPKGASRIYGPQKGLREEDFVQAESYLARLAEIVGRDLNLPGTANEPGAGAAGGLGFGLRCFFGACLESGFQLFARYARLEERIRNVQLVITGEGSIDASTLMGKGVGEVAMLCRKQGVPCIGLAGTLAALPNSLAENNPFTISHGIVPQLTTPEEAKANPVLWLPRLAGKAAQEWNGQL